MVTKLRALAVRVVPAVKASGKFLRARGIALRNEASSLVGAGALVAAAGLVDVRLGLLVLGVACLAHGELK